MAVNRVFLRLRMEQNFLEFERAFIFISPSYFAAIETDNSGTLNLLGSALLEVGRLDRTAAR